MLGKVCCASVSACVVKDDVVVVRPSLAFSPTIVTR
jgi:hypothetical protein